MEMKRKHIAIAVINAMAVMAVSGTAYAQSSEPQKVERVEVTGSAIKRIDAETAVPITVLKMDDLKKGGVTTVEQVLSLISAVQMQQSTSQVVGAGTGGATFANLRGIGENKTLVLLNGRRLANNALDSSVPDLNMIPFAALARVEVLRDGASALYGTDAIGGVINFITRNDYVGGTATLGYDSPQHPGGKTTSANLGFGAGDLNKDRFNFFGFVDYQQQDRIGGTQRPFNTRYAGGLSPTTNPANYYQAGDSGNMTAPTCAAGTNLISDGGTGCKMTTSSFVNYTPQTEKFSVMLKGTLRLGEDTRAGIEYFATQTRVDSIIAPVPYGGLYMNRVLANGTLNPFYPGNPGSSIKTPNIPLDPNYTEDGAEAKGRLPGFIHVKWRDLPNGPREDSSTNNQQRLVASLEGMMAGWDYQAAFTYNENKYAQNLEGYSNGAKITAGVLNGVINPFGAQTAAGDALIKDAALNGNLQNAKGQVTGVDAKMSRELGDWMKAGRPAALAAGVEFRHEKFLQEANASYAELVVSSTGFDPATLNVGTRNVYAGFAELNVPITKTLDVTAAVRYDNYSDFGSTTNPKFSFRYQPSKQLLMRGSYSTGFRAPSLYEVNSAQAYTNTSQFDDPVNCPGGNPIAGKPRAANCQQQFQSLTGGNANLKPEKSKNMTLGFVLEPVKDTSVGLDFWWIKLTDQIGSLPDTTVFGDPTTFASLFHRNPRGNLSTDGSECPDPATCGYVDLRTQNLGGLNSSGIDLSAAHRLGLGTLGALTIRLQSTYVSKYEYQDYAKGPWNKNIGIYSGSGPVFRWQHHANVTWNKGQFDAGLSAHYKSGYVDQDPDYNVASYTTFDVYGAWAPTKQLSITAGVRNLFDRTPPLSYQTAVFQAGYDPRFADPTGRTYYLRGTYNFR
jgi:iron complex outermembrane recepter protein